MIELSHIMYLQILVLYLSGCIAITAGLCNFFVDGVRLTQVQMTQFVEAERHYHVRLMPEEDPREPTRRNRSLVYDLEEAK